MHSYKADFPIFANNPGLIFLDSASSSQKPLHVIQGMHDFLSSSYANIHRGAYSLSEQSEKLYFEAKNKIANMLLYCSADEIIFTYNATYAYNMLAQTLRYSWVLKAWDTVLVDVAEHHANIVPWQMLSQRHGIVVERLDIDSNFDYSIDDFQKKYHNRVKVVSLSAASNVTWTLYDIKKISTVLRDDTFFVVDGSQAIPHWPIDVITNRIDALIFTWHKIMADTWLWVMYLAKKHIKTLQPARWGGGMIEDVQKTGFKTASDIHKFEPGTPHIVWAVSLLKALEYIEIIWWFDTIQQHEQTLVAYALERFAKNSKLLLFGKKTAGNRLWIFSFALAGNSNNIQLWEKLALENVSVRCWWHCTHPLFHELQQNWSCRFSTYIYTDIVDLEKTFDLLDAMTQ